MFEAWNWPQWAVFGWWAFIITIQFGAALGGVKVDYRKIVVQQVSIIVMAWVLYMGGFWS